MPLHQIKVLLIDFMGNPLDPLQLAQQIFLLFSKISMPLLLPQILLLELLGQRIDLLVVKLDDVLLLVEENLRGPHLNSGDLFDDFLVVEFDVLEEEAVIAVSVQLFRPISKFSIIVFLGSWLGLMGFWAGLYVLP